MTQVMGSNVDRWRKYAEALERDFNAAGEEIAQLRAALERIANLKPMSVLDPNDTQARARRMARKALNS